MSCGVKKAWHKIRLTVGAKEDLCTWKFFLRDFNGVSIIQDQMWFGGEDLQLFTDASGGIGFGGYFKGSWFQWKWPNSVKESHSIAWLEFFPILTAIVLWGEPLRGKRIILRTDNQSVVSIVNRQTSKCSKIMQLVRFFVLQCFKFNVSFYANHIPGKCNNIADALSRFQMDRFWKVAQGADREGTPVPSFLWNI